MKQQLSLQAIQHMAEDRILRLVGEDRMKEIRAADSKPLIKVFSIGHEGEAKGVMIGKGPISIQYFKDAIRAIYDNLRIGTKCFLGHAKTNSHTGRQVVGEVVGKALEEINGVLHDIVAVHIDKGYVDTKLDVASLEADVVYEHTPHGTRVVGVESLTGIALGDGDVDKPGFSGATLLGAMQAFEEKITMTKAEIAQAIKDGKYRPSDFFQLEDLRQDTVVRTAIDEALSEEKAEAAKIQDKLDKATARHAKELGELKESHQVLSQENLGLKATPIFRKIAGEQKLHDNQIKFLEKQLNTAQFKAENEEALTKAVNEFVTKGLDEFRELGTLFGVKEEPRGAAPTASTETTNDLTDPSNNDLIPKG
jgi:hypothetical protein